MAGAAPPCAGGPEPVGKGAASVPGVGGSVNGRLGGKGGSNGGSGPRAGRGAGHLQPVGGRRARRKTIGVEVPRFFTRPHEDPFASVEWELRDARIQSERGEVVFEQRGCEVPSGWSQLATNVVVSKYFRGH
ncbi:MAG: hypothetical protein ABFS46_10395, partial [Myxococcota bacterium]